MRPRSILAATSSFFIPHAARTVGQFSIKLFGSKLIGVKLLLLSTSAAVAAVAGSMLRSLGKSLTQMGALLDPPTEALTAVHTVAISEAPPSMRGVKLLLASGLGIGVALVQVRSKHAQGHTRPRPREPQKQKTFDLTHSQRSLSNPPTCGWTSPRGRHYMTFLSHYKRECGSDARYLKDLLQRMTGAEVFLDSSDLVSLETLFSRGVHQADCLLLLCSTQVLSRPYCLLELYEAYEHGIPIVELLVMPHEFPSVDDNRRYILNLEDELEERNHGAMINITQYLCERNISLDSFKSGLLAALGLNGARRQPMTWHAWGSDNQVVADAMDVVNAMAAATEQTLHWPITQRRNDQVSPLTEHNGQYAIFISYYRAEAGLDARALHWALEKRLGAQCFIDASCAAHVLGEGLNEINAIISTGVQRSKALLLIQTRSVLSRPFVLLEVFTALKLGIPIVTLSIEAAGREHPGNGYNHERAKAFLASLRENLSAAHKGAVELMDQVLVRCGSSFAELQSELFNRLPNVISIPWSPDGTANHNNAVIEDIVHKVKLQRDAKEAARTLAMDVSLPV